MTIRIVQISDCKEEEEEEEEEEEAKHFSIQTLISSEIQVVIFFVKHLSGPDS